VCVGGWVCVGVCVGVGGCVGVCVCVCVCVCVYDTLWKNTKSQAMSTRITSLTAPLHADQGRHTTDSSSCWSIVVIMEKCRRVSEKRQPFITRWAARQVRATLSPPLPFFSRIFSQISRDHVWDSTRHARRSQWRFVCLVFDDSPISR